MTTEKHSATGTRVSVRFDPNDLALLDEAAAAAGETRSGFIRQAAMGQSIPLRPLRGLLAEANASFAKLRRRYGNAPPNSIEYRQVSDEFPKLQRLVRLLIFACDRPVR